MSETDVPTGPCCICGVVGELPNLLMLQVRGPDSAKGKGWGCIQCGLPADGASAAACRRCMPDDWQPGQPKPGGEIRFACTGYVSEPGRVPIEELTEPFDHDRSKHPELQEQPWTCPGCGESHGGLCRGCGQRHPECRCLIPVPTAVCSVCGVHQHCQWCRQRGCQMEAGYSECQCCTENVDGFCCAPGESFQDGLDDDDDFEDSHVIGQRRCEYVRPRWEPTRAERRSDDELDLSKCAKCSRFFVQDMPIRMFQDLGDHVVLGLEVCEHCAPSVLSRDPRNRRPSTYDELREGARRRVEDAARLVRSRAESSTLEPTIVSFVAALEPLLQALGALDDVRDSEPGRG